MLAIKLIFTLFILFLLLLVVFILFSDFVNYLKGQPPFLPSSNKEVRSVLSIYDFKKSDKVVDLGSGDARILIRLAKKGVKSEGFEINPVLVAYSRLKIKILGFSDSIKIHNKNYLNTDFSNYNVFIIYGVNKMMPKLERKLTKEAGKDSIAICNKISFPSLKHSKKLASAYLYKL